MFLGRTNLDILSKWNFYLSAFFFTLRSILWVFVFFLSFVQAIGKGYRVEFHEPETWWKFDPEELEK